jgi:alpha-tubulin suppressor-like RCC1 family protein
METVFKAETLYFLVLLFLLISTAKGQLNTNVIAFGANDVKKKNFLTFSKGGNLGDGSYNQRTSPYVIPDSSQTIYVSAGNRHTLFLKNDSKIYAAGDGGVFF